MKICWWFGVALCATTIYLGAVLIRQGNVMNEIEPMYAIKHNEAIGAAVKDWQTSPFTDIKVVNGQDQCPNGYEKMFTRVWPGTSELCYRESDSKEFSDLNFHLNRCTYAETRSGWSNYNAKDKILMDKHGDSIICGKRGGL